VIRSERPVAAPATIVHAVLTDVTAWKLWAPHVASVDCVTDIIRDAAWSGLVKPWLGPAAQMDVTWVEAGRGMRWTTTLLGHRIDYADLITPDGEDRCLVTMITEVSGLVGGLVTTAVGPLSGIAQRRRLARLAALAEYLHRRAIVFAA
jgi:polyketide cyclase/dehydrase/lipid transport protein